MPRLATNAELNMRLNHLIHLWNKAASGDGQPVMYEHPDPEPIKEDK